MDNELLNEIHLVRNHSESTKRIYKKAVKKYTEYFSMSLTELIEEAELEEEQGIRWKKRKLKRRLLEFRQYLINNYALNTVKTNMAPILAIYKYYEIEVVALPRINYKAVHSAEPISFKDLPDKEVIRQAINVADTQMKAIIYFMVSSGCARRETLNLTIGDYIDALSEYTKETDIYSIINNWNYDDNIVPTFKVLRQKTGKYYTTYCSPEATDSINSYLLSRNDPLNNNSRLFDIEEAYLIVKFININNKLNLGKVGTYNRFRSHMLRKFHASSLYNDGMTLDKVNDLQGKSKNKTDTAYFMVNPEDLKYEYIQHLPAVTMSKDIEKLSIKSPEFIQIENENKELKTDLETIKEDIANFKKIFGNEM